jgi:D-erythronate 2-dehydrogenase
VKALITGGAGFIGVALTRALLSTGGPGDSRLERLALLDTANSPDLFDDPRVETVHGDVTERAVLERVAGDADCIWHLAAVVSAGAEADFDLGMQVNLAATMQLLEVLRATGRRPRFVFTSSLAVYGGALPDPVDDTFHLTPQTSYGTQKAIGELLVADYSRRGYIDGRCLRPPTVVVRPGAPNAAASAFASSIVREPLAGREVVCPVRPETRIVIVSPARVVEALITAMALPEDAWREHRTVQLPGLTVEVAEIVEALRRAGGEEAAARVRFEPDPAIERIVGGWAQGVAAERALELGFRADESVDEIVLDYLHLLGRSEKPVTTARTSSP